MIFNDCHSFSMTFIEIELVFNGFKWFSMVFNDFQ